jgi:hypothetical protein
MNCFNVEWVLYLFVNPIESTPKGGKEMKRLTVLLALALILTTSTAFSQPSDLKGRWEYTINYINSDPTVGYGTATEEFLIDVQIPISNNRSLFSGCALDGPYPPERGQYFSGVLDGKDIYLVHHDSITTGKFKNNVIEFKNLVFDIDDGSSETSIGTAMWQSNNLPDDECPDIPLFPGP